MSLLSATFGGFSFGWNAGLLFGTFDAVSRVLSGRYEWYELYLALLLPALILGILFSTLTAIKSLLRVPLKDKLFQVGVLAIGFWILVAGLSIHFAASKGTNQSQVLNYIGVFVVLLACLVAVAKKDVREFLLNTSKKFKLNSLKSAFCFLATFTSLFCFGWDIIRLNLTPATSSEELLESGSSKPNILFLTLDTVRAKSLSMYQEDVKTSPFLSGFAKSAVVFDQAKAPSSWTLPSHASMFTGKFVSKHGADFYHQLLDQEEETLAENLRSRGYNTAGVVAGPYVKSRYGIAQGFNYYFDRLDFFEYFTLYERFSIRRLVEYLFPGFTKSILKADGELIAPEVNARALKWLRANSNQPYFLFLNYFDAHDPYNLGKEYRPQFVNTEKPDSEVFKLLNEIQYTSKWAFEEYKADQETIDYLTGIYHAEIFYLDKQIQKLFKTLKKEGFLDNTIVVFTSDHGEEFFEHGGIQHGQTLYEEVIHVPLIISFPKTLKPSRVTQAVNLTSIYDTLLELIDNEPRKNSFADTLYGKDTSYGAPIVSELMGNPIIGGGLNMKSLTRGNWKYIGVKKPKPRIPESLFDLSDDPNELSSKLSERPNLAQEMKSDLSTLLEK